MKRVLGSTLEIYLFSN